MRSDRLSLPRGESQDMSPAAQLSGGGPPAREAGSPRQVGFLRGEPAGSYYCRGSLPTV